MLQACVREDRLLYFTFAPAGCLLDGDYFQIEIINSNACPRCGEVTEDLPVAIAEALADCA